MDWTAKELTGQQLALEIQREDVPVFVDFWAAWCPPCRMMEPAIEDLAEEFEERILVRKLNTDLYRKTSQQFNVSGVPTFVLFVKGEEVWRKTGALSKKKLKEILEKWA